MSRFRLSLMLAAVAALGLVLVLAWPEGEIPPRVQGGFPALEATGLAIRGPAPAAGVPEPEPLPTQPFIGPRERAPEDVVDPAPVPLAPPVIVPCLTGRVLDAEGRPASGVAVWIGPKLPMGVKTAGTDAAGRYALPRATGAITVRARGEETGTASLDLVIPAEAQGFEAPDLRLVEGGTIRGRVLGLDGKGLPDARVKAWSANGGSVEFGEAGGWFHVGCADVKTDSEGRFELPGLEDEDHVVEMGHMLVSWRFEPERYEAVRPGRDDLVFKRIAEPLVRGRVVDAETGKPISRFHVSGIPVEDPEGRFALSLELVPQVVVMARGYEPAIAGPARPGEREIVVRLSENPDNGRLRVRAHDETGAAVNRLEVRLWDGTTNPGGSMLERLEAPNGEAVIAHVSRGTYNVSVGAPGHVRVEWVPATVEAGATSEIEVTLVRGAPVRFRVEDSGGHALGSLKIDVIDDAGVHLAFRWRPSRPRGTLLWITESSRPEGKDALEIDDGDGLIDELKSGRYTLAITRGIETRRVAFEVPATGEGAITVRW